jgi:NADPH:quinone reductase-like Zn-dependent oxidoreductase
MSRMRDIPTFMPAVLLRGHGGFEQLEYRTDVPVPVPAADEVLLRIGAAAINNVDINTRTGWYTTPMGSAAVTTAVARAADSGKGLNWSGAALQFPLIQGTDGCGTIVATGSDVDPRRIGERVLVDPVVRSAGAQEVGYVGSEYNGAFAAYAVVPASNAWQISSGLTDVELASFPCSYATAENMLSRARVRADESVLVTGASGGVGSAAIQLARRRGAHVIAIGGALKSAALRALGATSVLARDSDLTAMPGRASVDVVIDVVGGAHFGQLLEVLRPAGRYAVAGAIGGAIVELDLRQVYLRDLTLLGCTVPDAGVFADLIGYIERGEIRALVSATYPLQQIVAAQQAFLSKEHIGKIVLTL